MLEPANKNAAAIFATVFLLAPERRVMSLLGGKPAEMREVMSLVAEGVLTLQVIRLESKKFS